MEFELFYFKLFYFSNTWIRQFSLNLKKIKLFELELMSIFLQHLYKNCTRDFKKKLLTFTEIISQILIKKKLTNKYQLRNNYNLTNK